MKSRTMTATLQLWTGDEEVVTNVYAKQYNAELEAWILHHKPEEHLVRRTFLKVAYPSITLT